MAWRDQLRPGSFRGAAFLIQEHEAEGGRRGEQHEYPGRDDPFWEDLGRRGKRLPLEAIVIGPDYMAARDALMAAGDAAGPGTLVHPFLGTFLVGCDRYSVRESTAEGGMATFSFEFVEAGRSLAGAGTADTAGAAAQAADDVKAGLPARFASAFSVASLPSFVEDAAATLVRSTATIASAAGVVLGGSGAALRTFYTSVLLLPESALTLVRTPLVLAADLIGLTSSIGRLGTPLARVGVLRMVMQSPDAFPAVIGETPSRARQASNQVAYGRLVTTAAAAEAVRCVAAATFSSYDEAIALRDALADDIDVAATAAADAGDDDAAADLDMLRRAMVRDVTARGGSLARLYGFVPAATEPALVIAHRLYRDPAIVLDRSADIVARNRIRHPGFVPGGVPLQVLTAEGGND